MSDFEKKLAKDLSQSREYRDAYAEAFGNEYLATQLRVLRKQRDLTQDELGKRIGSNQGRVSVFEDNEYGSWSLDTLRKLASELGVWIKVSFEPFGALVHEAARFDLSRLTRAAFENDPEILRLLERDQLTSPQALAQRAISNWATPVIPQSVPQRATLAGWLEGRDLPGFDAREQTPVQYILEVIPSNDTNSWNAIVSGTADLLTADRDVLAPLVRSASIFHENLFGLATAIGSRIEIQEALDIILKANRYESLGYEGTAGLVAAMIHNQVDDRWKGVWHEFLSTGRHSVLPGGSVMGIRGLLGLPPSGSYWRDLANGVREVEHRFLRTSQVILTASPNVMDELEKIVAAIFDWSAEPKAAQNLMRGSEELMQSGVGWCMPAVAIWAHAVSVRPGWGDTILAARGINHSTFANALSSGLSYYLKLRALRGLKVLDPSKTQQIIAQSSEQALTEGVA